MVKHKKNGTKLKTDKGVWLVVGVILLIGLLLWGVGMVWDKTRKVKSIEIVTFPGFVEQEANDTFDQAKAKGSISLAHQTTYTGNFDGSSSNGNDNFYVNIVTAGGSRKFTLNTANHSGIQLALYYMPPGFPTVPHQVVGADQDGVSPSELTVPFATTGEYEVVIHKTPTLGNTEPWSLVITDPNYVQACPWSQPADLALGTLPGSGPIQAYGDYIVDNTLTQSLWRGDQGWGRSVPINDGVLGTPGPWTGPILPPVLPGSGSIQAKAEYILGNNLRQTSWQSDQAWVRDVPIVNGVPAFTACSANVPTATPPAVPPTNTPVLPPTNTPTRTPTPLPPTPTRTPTPAGPTPTPVTTTTTLLPSADTRITSNVPGSNFGTQGTVRVVGLAGSETSKGYLKFTVPVAMQNKNVVSAQLRVFVSNTSANVRNIKQVTNNTWVETGMTYNNAPVMGAVIATMPGISATGWTGYYNLTQWVSDEVKAGKTQFSIGIDSTCTGCGDVFELHSREGTNDPQLVVSYY